MNGNTLMYQYIKLYEVDYKTEEIKISVFDNLGLYYSKLVFS